MAAERNLHRSRSMKKKTRKQTTATTAQADLAATCGLDEAELIAS
jgi:hypothetical protein